MWDQAMTIKAAQRGEKEAIKGPEEQVKEKN